MSYTKQEWEPASQEAAKIPEDKLRGRLIETMIDKARANKEIAELREKLAAYELTKAFPATFANVQAQYDKQVAELSNKLAQLSQTLAIRNTSLLEIEQGRDRLRKALERHHQHPACIDDQGNCTVCGIDEALAQPEEKL